MKRTPNKKMLGLFLVISFSILIGIVLFFKGKDIFSGEKNIAVLYFEESIKGLSIGSPVLFRGVQIGEVTKIDLMADTEELNFNIPIFIKINDDQDFRIQNYKIEDKNSFIKDLISKGLRARLAKQSYVTGQLMIELELLPKTEAIYRNKYIKNSKKPILEVPTVLSPMAELSKGLQNLSVREVADKFSHLLNVFNEFTPVILGQIAEFSTNLNNTLSKNSGEVYNVINNLNRTINDVGEAARAFKNFADLLERHPESLITGKGNRQ